MALFPEADRNATRPNPGSPEAKEAGCRCPVIDNGRGAEATP